MGNTVTFPVPGGAGLSDRLTRWVGRWRHGGVEEYFAAETEQQSRAQAPESRFAVNEERIWLDALPEVFSGLSIVQISDIHHGLFFPREWLVEVVQQANRLKPDFFALTGDFITYSKANIAPAAEILGQLRPRYGTLAVLGNHDFRVDAKAVASALERRHIEVLRNRNIPLQFGNQTMYLAGVDDYGYGANLRRALRGVPAGAATVLLAHNPRIITRAARYGISLVLSGHTHGGQVNLPLLGTVYGKSPERLRYKMGWDQLANTQIYVSRGIGTIVLPWRFRCPAEITRLELLPGASQESLLAAGD